MQRLCCFITRYTRLVVWTTLLENKKGWPDNMLSLAQIANITDIVNIKLDIIIFEYAAV